MKKTIPILLISILLIGCSKSPECIDQIINNTIIYHYNNTIIKEIEKTCPEEYDKSYVDGLIIEAKKCEENFTYLNLEDCEDDLDRMESRWDDCEEEIDEYKEEIDDCEDELCDLNSSLC